MSGGLGLMNFKCTWAKFNMMKQIGAKTFIVTLVKWLWEETQNWEVVSLSCDTGR